MSATPERWHSLEALYQAALNRPPGQRTAFLKEACADEPLRAEVESLLRFAPEGDPLLKHSPWAPSAAMERGAELGPYRIGERIGAGGMGEVYKAHDTRLGREVALKVLPVSMIGDDDRRARFVREAQSTSRLNHPNIVTIYDIGECDSRVFIAMEYVPGKTLDAVIPQAGLPLAETLKYAIPIASAVAKAHAAGIVHRDLKPGNIMVTPEGVVKVLDFGLAKLVEAPVADEERTRTAPPETQTGMVVGTPAFMSPEQAEGRTVDARSDIFSFGAVLYEMVTGKRAFRADSMLATMAAVLHQDTEPLPVEVPRQLANVILRCLRKDRERRFQNMADVRTALAELGSASAAEMLRDLKGSQRQPLDVRRVLVPVIAAMLLAAGGAWYYQHGARARWARDVALPEIARLSDTFDRANALPLILAAQKVIPQDPPLQRLLRQISFPVSIRTTPAGANVYAKPYGSPNSDWLSIGQSPIENLPLPLGYYRWRITKGGFRTLEGAASTIVPIQFTLDPAGSIPPDMVRVPGGDYQLRGAETVQLKSYWIDTYEVTNKQFKEFVDQGGYQNRQYWHEKFVKDGRALSWEQAFAEFRDTTGRPGPSTWELGESPQGHDNFPVNGVSWYEAVAYAEFAKKQLPTIYHWYKATDQGPFSDILKFSNIGVGGTGPEQVGSRPGIGPFGTYDMAGNVKEWVWNDSGYGRYLLGGAWNEHAYMYINDKDARSPFDRSPTNGFRCVNTRGETLPDELTRPVERPSRDYRSEKPVSDGAFRIIRSLYSYDRTELKPKIESVEETPQYWRRERITFDAAYGDERVIAWLFLPKNAARPYQTVIYFPGSVAAQNVALDDAEIKLFDFLVRSGRAVLYPVYKGTFERPVGGSRFQPPATGGRGPSAVRDLVIEEYKDFERSLDYVGTRSDVARDRLGFYGLSWGGRLGSILLAGETRIKAAVLVGGGLSTTRRLAEIDEVNFAPRVRTPTLMLNGRLDFTFPPETDSVPMFRLLGTPEKDKRQVLYDSGHIPPWQPMIKETLDWFDRHLGPVAR